MAKPKHPALAVLAVAGYPLIRLLPAKIASEAMAVVTSRFSHVFAKRKAMRRNLAGAFSELDERSLDGLVDGISANLGRLIAEIMHIPTFAAGRQGTSLTAEGALDFLSGEKGQAVFVGAHLGNWELAPILFRRKRHPLTIIYSRIGVEAVDRRLLSLRQKTGGRYFEKSVALRACLQAMQRGGSIALLIDQRVEAGAEVEFFGERTLFSRLPARMALRFDCPIVVVESYRTAPGAVHVVFHEPLRPEHGTGARAESELTQAVARTLEGAIRRHPDQWFCNKRRWSKRSARTIRQVRERPAFWKGLIAADARDSGGEQVSPSRL